MGLEPKRLSVEEELQQLGRGRAKQRLRHNQDNDVSGCRLHSTAGQCPVWYAVGRSRWGDFTQFERCVVAQLTNRQSAPCRYDHRRAYCHGTFNIMLLVGLKAVLQCLYIGVLMP